MMQYRGSDDDVVGFGHFSEVRKVKAGPADVVVTPTGAGCLFLFIAPSPRRDAPAFYHELPVMVQTLMLYLGYLW